MRYDVAWKRDRQQTKRRVPCVKLTKSHDLERTLAALWIRTVERKLHDLSLLRALNFS